VLSDCPKKQAIKDLGQKFLDQEAKPALEKQEVEDAKVDAKVDDPQTLAANGNADNTDKIAPEKKKLDLSDPQSLSSEPFSIDGKPESSTSVNQSNRDTEETRKFEDRSETEVGQWLLSFLEPVSANKIQSLGYNGEDFCKIHLEDLKEKEVPSGHIERMASKFYKETGIMLWPNGGDIVNKAKGTTPGKYQTGYADLNSTHQRHVTDIYKELQDGAGQVDPGAFALQLKDYIKEHQIFDFNPIKYARKKNGNDKRGRDRGK